MSAARRFNRAFVQRTLCQAAFALPLAATAIALVVGCSARPTGLAFKPEQSRDAFSQAFDGAYVARQGNGDTDIVLTRTTPAPAGSDKPAVQQLLHVRVLWEPGHAMSDTLQAVSANASIHWYVSGDGAANLVEYNGTGLVTLEREGEQVTVTIVKADVSPRQVNGAMTDPLGHTTLAGTIVARRDDARANALLVHARETIAAAKQASPLGDAAQMSADASR